MVALHLTTQTRQVAWEPLLVAVAFLPRTQASALALAQLPTTKQQVATAVACTSMTNMLEWSLDTRTAPSMETKPREMVVEFTTTVVRLPTAMALFPTTFQPTEMVVASLKLLAL